MQKIGVSDFVKDQTKKGGKSEIINISLEEIIGIEDKKNGMHSHESKEQQRQVVDHSCLQQREQLELP